MYSVKSYDQKLNRDQKKQAYLRRMSNFIKRTFEMSIEYGCEFILLIGCDKFAEKAVDGSFEQDEYGDPILNPEPSHNVIEFSTTTEKEFKRIYKNNDVRKYKFHLSKKRTKKGIN